MKKAKIILSIIFIITLTGCSFEQSVDDEHIVNNGGAYRETVVESTEALEDEVSEENEALEEGKVSEDPDTKVTKILSIFNIDLETENIDKDIESVSEVIHEMKGYINSHKITESLDKSYKRSAKVIIRIPKDKANRFIKYIKADFNIASESSQTIDITDSFFDLELNIESLDKQEDQLLLMYERTTNIEEMLKISDRLTEISKEKKKLSVDFSSMQERMNYSTIEITFNEVYKLKNLNSNLGGRIKDSVSNNLRIMKAITDNLIIFTINYSLIIILLSLGAIGYVKFKKGKSVKMLEYIKTEEDDIVDIAEEENPKEK